MKLIIGNAIVSCYADAASLLVMILLLFLSERIRDKQDKSARIFFLLCLQIAFTCVVCFVFNATAGHTSPLSHTVAAVSRILWELCTITTDCLWLTYVDQKLYGDGRKKGRQYVRIGIIMLYLVLLIINVFTGMIYTLSDNNTLQRKPLFYLMMLADFLLFFSAAVSVWNYDRKTMKTRFLRITPMIVSMLLAVLPQFFTPYNLGIIGYVTGVTLLYFSMATEIRFVDRESGLYNKGYLAYLFDLALAQKNDIRSVLILEGDGDLPALFGILRDVLHPQGDVIRTEEKKFMMFSAIDSRSTIEYLSSLVEDAVQKHNTEHPEAKIQISARCRMRASGTESFEFLRTAMDDKEAGNEMRGIVSMISELDRLDKELTMAADIQQNALPVNFPPFPERKEFSLYAFMTPAKEVGGDFYDFFLIDSDHLALVIADVSDKGIPAALFMMVSKTMIKNNLMSGCNPAEALDRTNRQLYEHNSAMMFVTVWLAVLELSTGKGVACNAGHEKPAVRRADGSFELLQYKHDRIVGGSPKAQYHAREFEMAPGDCLFVYTDGVPEASDAEREMFGEERLLRTLNEKAAADPEELLRHVHDTINAFVGDAAQFDDLTMLSLKYYGPQAEPEAGR